jgi:hypothetical protein
MASTGGGKQAIAARELLRRNIERRHGDLYVVELKPGAAPSAAAPVRTQWGPIRTAECVDESSEWSSWTVSFECFDGGRSQTFRQCSAYVAGECW